jgi:SRSO17 transposase
VPAERWIACSAGHGAKGRRLYDWIRVELAAPATAEMARWLLVRRSRRDGKLAFYACYGPAVTPLVGLVRVAGTRWAVEEGFQQAESEVGLDHYEVRRARRAHYHEASQAAEAPARFDLDRRRP